MHAKGYMQVEQRNRAIDILRGIAMVLMALDHVRYFFSNAECHPLDLRCTTSALFLTRWVTHFAAPLFVFLAGMSAFLMKKRKHYTDAGLARFLFWRGVLLIVLELTLVRVAWLFSITDRVVTLQVIWVLGCAMIFLSMLVYLPVAAVRNIGIVIILFHNFFDGIYSDMPGMCDICWKIIHQYGAFTLGNMHVLVVYPLIPWIGVMAVGYGCGTIFNLPKKKQKQVFFAIGLCSLLLFLLLRISNLYGDFGIWWPQKSTLFTLYSFINCMKYPPSLQFLLITLGPSCMLLAFLLSRKVTWSKPLVVLGKVPLFYYLLHLFFIHALAVCCFYVAYTTLFLQKADYPKGYGFDLPYVYIVWIIVIVLLYPLCAWYARFKKRHSYWWLSYF